MSHVNTHALLGITPTSAMPAAGQLLLGITYTLRAYAFTSMLLPAALFAAVAHPLISQGSVDAEPRVYGPTTVPLNDTWPIDISLYRSSTDLSSASANMMLSID